MPVTASSIISYQFPSTDNAHKIAERGAFYENADEKLTNCSQFIWLCVYAKANNRFKRRVKSMQK